MNNKDDLKSATEIKKYLDKALEIFVDKYVPFPTDYVKDKLAIHELFINKIISRKETLNRPRIFTPNYDLALKMHVRKLVPAIIMGLGVSIEKI